MSKGVQTHTDPSCLFGGSSVLFFFLGGGGLQKLTKLGQLQELVTSRERSHIPPLE